MKLYLRESVTTGENLVSVIGAKEPTAFGISPKTARAVADPWRLRILSEVGAQPMSPSQFVDEFGGELTHVARCFRQLAKWDYIEVVEKRQGRRRGAAVEHVYRATRRAYFDTATWEDVSRVRRASASRSTLSAYQRRIRAALEAGTFDQETDRHLSWDAIVLDRTAWGELGVRLDEILNSLLEHEVTQANTSPGNPSVERIPAIVGLAAFRSPEEPSRLLQGAYRQPPTEAIDSGAIDPIGPELAKALSNRWRCQIVSEVGIRPLSPSQFVEEFGGSMTHIARCFRELAEWGFLEVFEERNGGRHGGGVERIYRSTRRPYFDTPTWESLPEFVRAGISQFILTTYFARVTEAIETGAFDAETDRHLSWSHVIIDREAWREIGVALDEVLAWLPSLETESLERTRDVEELIPTTVGLACFRSPGESQTFAD
jgi:hypothetical protein